MKRFISLLLVALMLMSLSGCSGNKVICAYEEETPSLYEQFEQWFGVGAAINSWNLDGSSEQYKTITKHFNVFVYENESKPDATHPSEDRYNFANVDKFVEFGEQTGATLRGHTLLWHSQCPDWFFFDSNGNYVAPEVLLERIDEHVTTIVSRYAGKIDTWDVVNEVISDGAGLRDSHWYNVVGDYDGDGDKYDYIEQAFRSARAADPDARLIINDYNMEWSESKTISMYLAVKQMLSEGVPIDGVGLQMHIGPDLDVAKLRSNIEILLKLRDINPDFVIEVTEMDMNMTGSTKEDFEKQAAKYAEMFQLFIDLAEEGVLDTVVFWGFYDGASWLNKSDADNYPMLFDREFMTKPAFWSVLEVAENNKK